MGLMGVNASGCVKATAQGAPEGINFLTAEALIVDCWATDGPIQTNHIYDCVTDWYREKALAYFKDHNDLIALMEAGC